MTPEEAAKIAHQWRHDVAPSRAGLGEALDVLIDHARATGHDAKSRGPEYWRGHADGKLEQQATTACEIVTGYTAAQLPLGSYVVECAEDGMPSSGARALMIGDDGELDDPPYRILYRAPEPVAPPAKVGDTVETAAQLDALPVGAVVRVGRTFVIGIKHVNGGFIAGGVDILIEPWLANGVRVLDLPEATS